jgi:hypothetical protein
VSGCISGAWPSRACLPEADKLRVSCVPAFRTASGRRSGLRSGALEGKPITYDGNTAGAFRTGRAVIDGSEPVSGWGRCQSAEECGGNPNWKSIYTAWLPGDIDPLGAALLEDDQMIWVAQEPDLKDPFYLDDLTTYGKVPANQVTTTTLSDPAKLTQADPHYWDGATLLLWGTPNLVYPRKIMAFDPARRDFLLREGSPAIDAGVDVGLKEDVVGTRVPQGKAPDIGPYEYEDKPERTGQ